MKVILCCQAGKDTAFEFWLFAVIYSRKRFTIIRRYKR